MATLDRLNDPQASAAAPPAPPEAVEDELLEAALDQAAQASPGRAARPRIREFEAIVEEAIRETADTTTLVFFTGSERMEYEAGQFLTIRPHQFPALDRFVKFFEDVKGKREPARAYSMCSAPHDRRLA